MKKFLAMLVAFVFLFTVAFPAVNVQAATQDVFFDGNGGTFNIIDPNWTGPTTVDFFGAFGEEGMTIASENMAVTDPTFFDPSRQFLGWLPCEMQFVDSINFNYIPLTSGPVSTQYMNTQFVIPNHPVVCVAQWSGNDEDYFSDVVIHGYGADVVYKDIIDPGEGTYDENPMEVRDFEDMKVHPTESLGTQMEFNWQIKEDPKKAGATFEGWIEFSVKEVTDAAGTRNEYTLVSGTPITTQAMMDKMVPSYDVVYVAKWSDIPVEAYFADEEKPVVEEIVIPGSDEKFALVMDGTVEIPNAAATQYDTVAKVEAALKEALFAGSDLDEDVATVAYLEIILKVLTPNGWMTVTGEDFPEEGLEVVIPYPAGVDKDAFEFAVTHMISSGEKAGQIEVLDHTETEEGLLVKVYSLSPFAVAYEEVLTDGEGSATGDFASVVLWMGVMALVAGSLVIGYGKLRRN